MPFNFGKKLIISNISGFKFYTAFSRALLYNMLKMIFVILTV